MENRQRPVKDEGTGSGGDRGRGGFTGWQVFAIVVLTVIATAGISAWLLGQYVFADELDPVELRADERRALADKLRAIRAAPADARGDEEAQPERYSEVDAARTVRFSERELNGLLANEGDLARRVAIDLSADLLSVLVLVTVPPDFPVLGGRTLRVHAGVELDHRGGDPVVKLRGVSVMGVPVPSAWLGDLKNVDLVERFGAEPGFWQSFAEGVAETRVEDGALHVRLHE